MHVNCHDWQSKSPGIYNIYYSADREWMVIVIYVALFACLLAVASVNNNHHWRASVVRSLRLQSNPLDWYKPLGLIKTFFSNFFFLSFPFPFSISNSISFTISILGMLIAFNRSSWNSSQQVVVIDIVFATI